MEDLPLELLLRVLGALPPSDLVVCRSVCARWRAAVAALAERDRKSYYRCGWADVEEIDQVGQFFETGDWPPHACTCGVVLPPDMAYVGGGERFLDETPQKMEKVKRMTTGTYAVRHRIRLPPARWEVLARERDLAMDLTDIAMELSRGYHVFCYAEEAAQFTLAWLPSWVYLPDELVRPTTAPALAALVRYVFKASKDNDRVAHLAAHPAEARALYAEADRAWAAERERAAQELESTETLHPSEVEAAWRGAWENEEDLGEPDMEGLEGTHTQFASWIDYQPPESVVPAVYEQREARFCAIAADPSGWARWQWDARVLAAVGQTCIRLGGLWRDALVAHMMGMHLQYFDDDESFDDEQARAILNDAVAAVDTVKADFEDMCSLASVVCFDGHPDRTCRWWVGGISPSGHLVGAYTAYDAK